MLERAAIYVLHDDLEQATIRCLEYAQASGYHMEGIVIDRWDDVQQMIDDGVVDVVIVAEPWHLPSDRVPRIEIVSQQQRLPPPPPGDDDEGPPTPPGRRRPKPVG